MQSCSLNQLWLKVMSGLFFAFFSHVRLVHMAGGFVVLPLIFDLVVMHHVLESGVLSHL